MMYARTFAVHLPSNTKNPPENTASRFTIRLPRKLEFNSQWLVGLSVIQYPRTWPTFENQWLWIRDAIAKRNARFNIPSRTIDTPQELVDLLNASITDPVWRRQVAFQFDVAKGRFVLTFGGGVDLVAFSDELAYTMGFKPTKLTVSPALAEYEPDLSGGLNLIYVYAPGLIEPVIVGDESGPLLRVVNVKGFRNRLIEQIYDSVEYHRLLTKEISEISIELLTHTGKPVPFQYGSSFLTLSFRKAPLT
jgi:hypothetical protein